MKTAENLKRRREALTLLPAGPSGQSGGSLPMIRDSGEGRRGPAAGPAGALADALRRPSG